MPPARPVDPYVPCYKGSPKKLFFSPFRSDGGAVAAEWVKKLVNVRIRCSRKRDPPTGQAGGIHTLKTIFARA